GSTRSGFARPVSSFRLPTKQTYHRTRWEVSRAEPGVSFTKTRTPPEEKAGSREHSCGGAGAVVGGSVRETHGRARGSSRNVVLFIHSTPRAGAGCPRSLAQLAAG